MTRRPRAAGLGGVVLRLAGWVQRRPDPEPGHSLLLGPRLKLLRVPDALLDVLDDAEHEEAVAVLREGGFVEPAGDTAPRHVDDAPGGEAESFLIARSHREEARALIAALDERGSRRWSLRSSLEEIGPSVPGGAPPLIAILDDIEPCDPLATLRGLFGRAKILWFGECAEGTHAGPVFSTIAEVEAYVEATRTWAFARNLARMGFDRAWPLPIARAIRADARAVARAVDALASEPPGTCCLIEEGRLVSLWTSLRGAAQPIASLRERQRWSKGILRGLRVEPIADLPSVFLGKCQTPCAGIAELESNSGKGMSREEAENSTIGEAIERFAACEANHHAADVASAARAAPRHALADFHPFGPPWERYLQRRAPDLPMRATLDIISGERVEVPACLVPFPYEPGEPKDSPTFHETSGLAAYPSWSGAVLRGALEVLERNDFYPPFLHQRSGRRLRLPASTSDSDTDLDVAAMTRVLGHLAERDVRAWLLAYDHDALGVPIVHAFLFDPRGGFMSRGSGSGGSFAGAARRALAEAVQIRAQHRIAAPPSIEDAYANWKREAVVQAIVAYLEAQPEHPMPMSPPLGDDALLERVERALARRGRRLLVATLPCPVEGWTAVRVLVPGLTTSQYPSDSAGGQRLLGHAFTYGVPT